MPDRLVNELARVDAILAARDLVAAQADAKIAYLQAIHEVATNLPAQPVSAELLVNATAERLNNKAGRCPSSWLQGSTTAGERFGKELYCGAEWCPVCGSPDSVSHNRRFESWLPKAQQVKHLGLFVIEFPLASRNKPRSRKALEYYGKLAVKVLSGNYEVDGRRKRGEMLRRGEVGEIKAKYYERGMRRWHYFGDVKKELSKLVTDLFTAENEPDILAPSVKSNVHLNCLVDAGFIPRPWLMHIVHTLREAFNEPNLIVHYGYVRKPGRMVHLLKYTTRATFLNIEWDKWLAGQLFGFRNMRSWGKWIKVSRKTGKLPDGAAVWCLTEADIDAKEAELMAKRRSVGAGVSYKTGLRISWSNKPRCINELRAMEVSGDAVSLGRGYYELAAVSPPVNHVIDSDALVKQLASYPERAKAIRKKEYDQMLANIHAGAELERKYLPFHPSGQTNSGGAVCLSEVCE